MIRHTVRFGDRGADVGVMQRIVGVTPDEVFGPKTLAAVKVWQRDRNLDPDGIFGAKSWVAAGESWEPSYPARQSLVAPACLAALRDANAAWPDRSRRSDGTLGDASHRTRPSDHNTGNAVDITHDPYGGPDCEQIARHAIDDPRVTYVIWNRRIWNRDKPGWRQYSGTNPHTRHIHISVRADMRDDASKWGWAP